MASSSAAAALQEAHTPRALTGHTKKVQALSWNCTGTRLATASADKTVRLWTFDGSFRGRCAAELKGHEDTVEDVVWDPTHASRLASISLDGTVKLWDIRSPSAPTHTIRVSGENIAGAWSPDGRWVLVGNRKDVLSVIDVSKRRVMKSSRFQYEVNEFQFAPDSAHVVVATNQSNGLQSNGSGLTGVVDVLRLNERDGVPDGFETVTQLESNAANCIALSLDPSGRRMAVGAADALVSLWDLQSMTCEATIQRMEHPIRGLSFSFDGSYVASVSEDPAVDIADAATGEQVHRIRTSGANTAVAWHPSALVLAHAGEEESGSSSSAGAGAGAGRDRRGRDRGGSSAEAAELPPFAKVVSFQRAQ